MCSICIVILIRPVGASTDRTVTIFANRQPTLLQYPIGNLFEIANLNTEITLTHIGYQTLNQIQTTQCVQVLTTGTLGQQSCNLPQYCGRVEYFKNSSTWFTEVGLCIGLGPTPIIIDINGHKYTKNLYNVYQPSFPQHRFRHLTYIKELEINGQVTKYRQLTMEDVSMLLLNLENTDDWYIYSNSLIWSFPMYNTNIRPLKPYTQSVDSKICIPTISENLVPIILGPMSKETALYNSMFTQYVLPGMTPTTKRFIVDYDSIMDGKGKIVRNNGQFILTCDPAKETMSLLPISLTTILNTIGQAVTIVITTIFSALLGAVYYAAKIINNTVNIYLATLIIIINVYKYKLSLFDSVLSSIFITIVLQQLHGHYNVSYN